MPIPMNRFHVSSSALLSMVAATLAFCGSLPLRADITLPSLFSDNMVIQQRQKFTVWGKADPHESVTVQIGADSAQTSAGEDGAWSLKLDGLKSGGPYDMTVSGKNSITVHNVAFGEVWVCSGESNMEFKVLAAANGAQEMADANLPMVRFFTVKHAASDKQKPDCEGSWSVCDPDTVGDFSAVGYFFAKELNRSMRVPIGIIQSAWGPSPAEAWTPKAVLEKNPLLHAAVARYDTAAAAYPAARSAYEAKLADWKSACAQAKAAGSPLPRAPIPPLPPGGPREPAALFNGMIYPLLRYPIRGVAWYQGESDTADPALYRVLFPAMIASWRSAWGMGDFPFLYVQLSDFLERHPQPGESRWADLRESQAAALATPKTGMAVTVDIGAEHDMHPPDKEDVGRRLAFIARSQVYGQPHVAASGPSLAAASFSDGKATLSFTHAEEGLKSESQGKTAPLKGFALAGSDRHFVWADAEIHGNKVIVQSPQVPNPVAVRYAWADFPDATLYNKSDLPAAPFRTDSWTPDQEPAPASAASPSPLPAKHRKHHSAQH